MAVDGYTLDQSSLRRIGEQTRKGELRRTIQGNGLSLNKARLTDQEYLVTGADLISESYLLIQKGKKNYYIIEAV